MNRKNKPKRKQMHTIPMDGPLLIGLGNVLEQVCNGLLVDEIDPLQICYSYRGVGI